MTTGMGVAVVGAGVVGLSTTAALAAAGADVVCFERSAAVMGERSAGSSRIFRLAHADPDLVRYAAAARDGFARWAARAGTPMVRRCGCVVSGGDAVERAAAMDAAGARHEVVEAGSDRLRLPATVAPGTPVLVDPDGGVVDVDAVRAFLAAQVGRAVVHEPVYALDVDDRGATVWSPTGARRVDGVVLAAGAGTSALAAQVEIFTPPALQHHARFTFAVDEPAGEPWPSWIDTPADGGLATYQHRSGPGRWAVGGSVEPALVAWEVGRDAAVAASRAAVLDHARARWAGPSRIVETLYCTHVPDTGDGITFRRRGCVLAVDGENLMKFAPVLGETLAAAAVDGSTPATPALLTR